MQKTKAFVHNVDSMEYKVLVEIHLYWHYVLISQLHVHSPGGDTGLQAVRYAKSIVIHVELQSDQADGHIYPPYVSVKYAVATAEDYQADNDVTVLLLLLINVED